MADFKHKWRAVATAISAEGVVAVSISTFPTKAKAIAFADDFLCGVDKSARHADVVVEANPPMA